MPAMTGLPTIPRILLLVDDEINIINALKRTLRRDNYTILTANSGEEGLALLASHKVGVIISEALYPMTFRIVLSGYTELESVTSAINEGAIYKFLTKPWDDDLLCDNIREAFHYYEINEENLRLTRELQTANEKLSIQNLNLEKKVVDKNREFRHSINLLDISREILEHLPLGIIGIDEQNMIVVSNRLAETLFCQAQGCLLGLMTKDVLTQPLLKLLEDAHSGQYTQLDMGCIPLDETISLQVLISKMGDNSPSKGIVMILSPLNKN
ncbi:MAG: PAS domain-containing protein [Methylobacter sp.]|nr:PAS domain-containing protein [Methylobacter sp.]